MSAYISFKKMASASNNLRVWYAIKKKPVEMAGPLKEKKFSLENKPHLI